MVWTTQTLVPYLLHTDAKAKMQKKRQELALRCKRGGRSFRFSTEAEIKWVKPGREFAAEGSLFDVAEQHDSAGFILITAIEDGPELALLKKFNKQQRERQKQGSKQIQNWLVPVFLVHLEIKDTKYSLHTMNYPVSEDPGLSEGHLRENERPPTNV